MPVFLSFYVFISVIITMENMSRYFCNFYNLPNNENARAWVSLANLEWNNWVILMAINIQIVSHRCPYVPTICILFEPKRQPIHIWRQFTARFWLVWCPFYHRLLLTYHRANNIHIHQLSILSHQFLLDNIFSSYNRRKSKLNDVRLLVLVLSLS